MDAGILWSFGVARKGEQWKGVCFFPSYIGLNGGNMNKKR
jgi:hypothetical protein